MKKLLLTLLACGLVAGIVNAQTPKDNLVFGGFQYTTKAALGEKNLVMSGGYGWRISGDLWQLNTGQIGSAGYIAAEPVLAYVFNLGVTPRVAFRAALHAGVSSDWVQFADSTSWIAYVPGVIGGSITAEWPNGAGIAFSAREKIAFSGGTQYINGWLFNLNVIKRF